MPEFPENQLDVLHEYFPTTADGRPKRAEIVAELEAIVVDGVPSDLGARSVNAARRTVLDFLTYDAVVALDDQLSNARGTGIYDRITQRELGLALAGIDQVRPDPSVPRLNGTTVRIALRRTPITYTETIEVEIDIDTDVGHDIDRGPFPFPGGHLPGGRRPGGGPVSKPRTVEIEVERTLKGYRGPSVSAGERRGMEDLRDLAAGGAEHGYRVGLLRAECHVGRREHQEALDQLQLALGTDGLGEPWRKDLAIREASVHLALGDELFRRNRRIGEDDRAAAIDRYDRALEVLADHGVSPDNPRRQRVVEHGELQKSKLAGGFNWLGLRDSAVPFQRFTFLDDRTRHHIAEARRAAGRFDQYLGKANQLEDVERELRFELEAAEIDLEVAELRESAASKRVQQVDLQIDAISDKIDAIPTPGDFFELATLPLLQSAAAAAVAAATGNPSGIPGVVGALVGFHARKQELEHQKRSAEVQREIAELERRIAGLEADMAHARFDFVETQLEVTGGRRLNKDLYYALANTYEQLLESHLDAAIRYAYLYERAVAYLVGRPEIEEVAFRYRSAETGVLAAADQLGRDVDAVTAELGQQEKSDPFPEIVSLRQEFPVEFSQLQQTGQMAFALPLYWLDERRPGSYQRRIVRLELEVRGLVPPTGFTGLLTHLGRFMLHDRDSTLAPETDRLIPTDEQVEAALEAQRRGQARHAAVGGVVLYDLGPDSTQLNVETQSGLTSESQRFTLGVFEGYAPTGLWRLRLGGIDLRFVTDVLVTFHLQAFETDLALEAKVRDLVGQYEDELAGGDALDRITAFSLRQQFPDAFFELETSQASFTLAPDDLPAGLGDLQTKMVVGQALDEEGKGVEGIGIEVTKPGTSFALARTTGLHGFTEDVSEGLGEVPPEDRAPVEGTWEVRLPDPAQFAALGDLRLFFLYSFGGPS